MRRGGILCCGLKVDHAGTTLRVFSVSSQYLTPHEAKKMDLRSKMIPDRTLGRIGPAAAAEPMDIFSVYYLNITLIYEEEQGRRLQHTSSINLASSTLPPGPTPDIPGYEFICMSIYLVTPIKLTAFHHCRQLNSLLPDETILSIILSVKTYNQSASKAIKLNESQSAVCVPNNKKTKHFRLELIASTSLGI